jgi:hypothetical protein
MTQAAFAPPRRRWAARLIAMLDGRQPIPAVGEENRT